MHDVNESFLLFPPAPAGLVTTRVRVFLDRVTDVIGRAAAVGPVGNLSKPVFSDGIIKKKKKY